MKKRMTKLYVKYMYAIGLSGSLIYFLQAYKIFHDKNTSGLSLSAFLVALFSVLNWTGYGIIVKDRVLTVSNILSVIGVLLVVIGIVIYHP